MRDHMNEEREVVGGALQTHVDERYDLIPPEAIRLLAERYGLGAKKYAENNWKRGDKEFVKARINHVLRHTNLLLRRAGDMSIDDDLAAILWGWASLAWFRANKPNAYFDALNELKDAPMPLREKEKESANGKVAQ